MKPNKDLVIFTGIQAEYFIKDCERILKARPEMHVNGSWSFGEVVPSEERCGLYDFLSRDVTPVKLCDVVEEVKKCIDEPYKKCWKVYLYK